MSKQSNKNELNNRRRTFSRRRLSMQNLEDRRLMAVYTVNTDAGAGPGSLRAAITQANDSLAADTIRFATSLWGQTITVQTPLPEITGTVEIEGPAPVAGRVTIDADGNAFRPLTIDASAVDVTINNLVLTGGDVRGLIGDNRLGGGIFNSGTGTTLSNVIVEDNLAAQGGGVFNDGDLTIQNSKIRDNVAESDTSASLGGGIVNKNGTLNVSFSDIYDNNALGQANGAEGGGVAARGGATTIEHSSIRDNSVVDEFGRMHGGGVSATLVVNPTSTDFTDLNIFGSTIRDNMAAGDGGGIYTVNTNTIVHSTTIANNTATNGTGGGVYLLADTVVGPSGSHVPYHALHHITVTGNQAATVGGVFSDHLISSNVWSSIVAENTDSNGDVSNTDGALNKSLTFDGDFGGDPMLGPLQDNGGPVWTRVPMEGSPVIDSASTVSTLIDPDIDAHLKQRPVDGDRDGFARADQGAVEFIPKSMITGRVVNDLDGDNLLGATETGLNGWTIQLVDPTIGIVVAETTTASMDVNGDGTIDEITESGYYEFADADNGYYRIDVDLPDFWVQNDFPASFDLVNDMAHGDIFVEPAKQHVFNLRDELDVPVPISDPIYLPVHYKTNNRQDTTGIGVRVHFDSSWLSFQDVLTDEPSLFHDPQVLPDTEDFDNDPLTDQFVIVSFVDSNGDFPEADGGPDDADGMNIFSIGFNYAPSADHSTGIGSTDITYTAASTDARYAFEGDSLKMNFYGATLDINQDGRVDALSDGLLITRYILGATGDDLIEYTYDPNGPTPDAEQIRNYLDAVSDTMLDVDGNGLIEAFNDGVVISRYMLGYRGNGLSNFVPLGSTRTTAEEIEAHLASFMPGGDAASLQLTGSAQGESTSVEATRRADTQFSSPFTGTQIVHTTATEASRDDQAQLSVRYESSPADLPTFGLATRVHYDSSKLELDAADHFAPDLALDQVFADTEDWDNDPETDMYYLSGFVDPNGDWEATRDDDQISQLQFAVVDADSGPTKVNVTAIETPGEMGFTGQGTSIAFKHTNDVMESDVNGDGKLTPFDALLIINELNKGREVLVGTNFSPYFFDVNPDEKLTPFDALRVINELALLDSDKK